MSARVRLGLNLLIFGFGLTITSIAPMMPSIIEQFNLSLSQGSLFNMINNFGGFVGIILAVIWGDRMKKTLLYQIGYSVFTAALFAISLIRGYYVLLAVFFIMGIGARVVDVMGNPIITSNYPQKAGKYLSTMHMFIGIGGLSGPVLVGALISLGFTWQTVFRFNGFYCVCVLLASPWFFRGSVEIAQHSNAPPAVNLWKNKLLWKAGAIAAFSSGYQAIFNVWSAMYMERQFALPTMLASIITTLVWVGITLSRVIYSMFKLPFTSKQILIYGSLISAVTTGISFFQPYYMFTIAAMTLSGLMTGVVMPLVIDRVTREYPYQAGRLTAILFLCSILTVMIFPWICGVIADATNFSTGMLTASLALLIVFIIALWFD